MSVTHVESRVVSVPSHRNFAADHPQLAPFLLAVAMVTVSILVALMFTGLPR